MTVESMLIFVVVAFFVSTVHTASFLVSFPILIGSGAPSPLSTIRCSSHNCVFCPTSRASNDGPLCSPSKSQRDVGGLSKTIASIRCGQGPTITSKGFQKERLLHAQWSCLRVFFFSSANLAERKEGRSFAVRRRRICLGGSSLALLLRLLASMELRGEVQEYSRELNFLWTCKGREMRTCRSFQWCCCSLGLFLHRPSKP